MCIQPIENMIHFNFTERYIAKAPELSTFLYRLVKNNKKLFVISNSSAAYM